MSHPQRFYKYLSPDGAEAVLRTGRLRWSSPLVFDDPAEFRRMPRFQPSLQEAGATFVRTLVTMAATQTVPNSNRLSSSTKLSLALICQLLASGMPAIDVIQELGAIAQDSDDHFTQRMNEFVENLPLRSTRVLCVTVEQNNHRLWNEYADGHRGVVLEFSHLPEHSTPLLAAKEVVYSAEPPIVGSGLDFLLYGDTRELRRRGIEAIVYTKKDQWRYQREWRAVTWRDEGEALFGHYRFLPSELASVTIGSGASDKWACDIRKLVGQRYPTCQILLEMT